MQSLSKAGRKLQKVASTHFCLPWMALAALGLLLSLPGTAPATGENCQDDRDDKLQAQIYHLPISPRRQWDCNFGSEHDSYDPGGLYTSVGGIEPLSWHSHINACQCPLASSCDTDDDCAGRNNTCTSDGDDDDGSTCDYPDDWSSKVDGLKRRWFRQRYPADQWREKKRDFKDSNDCMDSCPGSPRPFADRKPLSEQDADQRLLDSEACRCGERQASLANLCKPTTPECISRASQADLVEPDDLLFDPAKPNVKLRIPNCSGYCGASSVQQAALHQGVYVSQGVIRRLLESNDNARAIEILIDPTPQPNSDLYEVVKTLGLGAERWYPDNDDDLPDIYGASCGSESFLKWVGNQIVKTVPDHCGTAGGPECHFLQGNAVITGVRLKDDEDNTDAYVHIVPIVGVDWSDSRAGQRETNGQLILNSNYSADELDISAEGLGDGVVCRVDGDTDWGYCLAASGDPSDDGTTSWGVSVQAPPEQEFPVRIESLGCTNKDGDSMDCKLGEEPIPSELKDPDLKGWMEPNWSVNGIDPVYYEMTATVESPIIGAETHHGLRIARVDADGPKRIRALRENDELFGVRADACYPEMKSDSAGITVSEDMTIQQNGFSITAAPPVGVGIVRSDRAAFFHVVTADEAAAICPEANEPIYLDDTRPLAQCEDAPRSPCRTPDRESHSRLVLRTQAEHGRDRVHFLLKHLENAPIGALGHPKVAGTDYRFCLYEGTRGSERLVAEAPIPREGSCGARDCWISAGDKGHTFKDRRRDSGDQGIYKVKLRTGGSKGDSYVSLKARGKHFSDLTTPPEPGHAIVGQLVNNVGQCWSASEYGPESSAR